MKGLLISNNKADETADERLPLLKEALGGEVISATLEDFECLSQIPQRELEMGCQWVAAAGGDGVRGCVAQELIGTELPLGVIPSGTFNNFARSLGLPLDPIAACRVVQQRNVEPVDVGVANGKPFFECLGTGLDAALFPIGEQIKSGRFSCLKDRIIRIPALMVTVAVHLDGTPTDLWPLNIQCQRGALSVFREPQVTCCHRGLTMLDHGKTKCMNVGWSHRPRWHPFPLTRMVGGHTAAGRPS